MLEQIGPFPVGRREALKQARWWTALLGLITRLQMEGRRGIDKLAKEARANAAAAARVLPHDILFSAAAALKADEEDMQEEAGGKVESRPAPTPAKEPASDGSQRARAVRCDPS